MRKTSIKDRWILFFRGYDTRVTTLKVLRNQVNNNNINFWGTSTVHNLSIFDLYNFKKKRGKFKRQTHSEVSFSRRRDAIITRNELKLNISQ